jgi:hypothetical protein
MQRDQLLRLGFGAIVVLVGVQMGCTHPAAGSRHASGVNIGVNKAQVAGVAATGDTHAAPNAASDTPDLSKPFRITQNDNDSWLAPLNITRLLGRSAGGTWVAFTQKPLDDVKWPTQNARYANNLPPMTCREALEALRKAGTPIAWGSNGKSAMLIDYGPPSELNALLKQQPTETVGLFMRAETVPALLQAVNAIWRIQAEADPELIRQRAAFVAARQQREADEAEEVPASLIAVMNGANNGINSTQPERYTTALEFKAVKRLDLDGLMQELARALGGGVQHADGNQWRFARLSDPKQVAAEIARLKGVIDQETASIMAGSTSYESRTGGLEAGDSGGEDQQQPADMPQMNEEPTKAFDALGVLGNPAIPTLAGYLDTERPPLALAAVRTLDALATPEAKSALAAFALKLQTPPKDRLARALLPQLQSDVIRRIGRDPIAGTVQLLAEIALNPEAMPQVRTAARMAVARTGDLTPFAAGLSDGSAPSDRSELSHGEMEFVLRDRPAGSSLQPIQRDQKRGAITPLAVTKSADGADWAVFVAGRLGDPNDLWLAHGRNGRWDEFLFTGQVFTHAQNYGQDVPPQPGACVLAVKGESLTISPPNQNTAAEMASLQKQMQDPQLPQDARMKAARRYSELSQRNVNVLDKPITLSLADLRRDSDHDGLPDLVEVRLGLDPHKADTDGDGVPDGKDANPLAGPARSGSDRVHLLQAVFTALYGGDESPEPILVILDRDQWQEFHGAHGRVLCITPADYRLRIRHLAALRTLQFGGPQDAESTILQKDGPCLFNDSHTRAEVHFWQWRLHAPQSGSRGGLELSSIVSSVAIVNGNMNSATPIIDYTARFERKEGEQADWHLVTIKPSRFQTSDRALTTLMQAGVSGGGAGD